MTKRCFWCGEDPEYVAYHDTEWGIPVRDDRHLFELLCLEGQQAGLSWIVVLRKRAYYRKVFKRFEIGPVSRIKDKTLERLLVLRYSNIIIRFKFTLTEYTLN